MTAYICILALPSSSMIWAVTVLSTNRAKAAPLVMVPVSPKVSVCSTLLSLMMVIETEGCDSVRGPSPALKLSRVDTGL